MRQKLLTGMAFFLGAVTSFQAAGVQLYFLFSGILGAGTGWLLRQNGFRRFIRIRPLPSKESTELYTKVVKGELTLSQIKGKDGKVRYQAPTPRSTANPAGPNRRNAATLSSINIKAGTPLPAHLKREAPKIDQAAPDRDTDFQEGAQGTLTEKLDYYRRNYRIAFVYRRMQAAMDNFVRKAGYGGKQMTETQRKRKERADAYELERKRRFENRG